MDGDVLVPEVAEHELVLLDEILLEHLDDFHGDDEGDGDHGVHEHEVGEEGDEAIDSHAVGGPVDVAVRLLVVASGDAVPDCAHDAQHYLDCQDNA